MNSAFKIHSYNTDTYPFRQLIKNLYKVDKLEKLHLERLDLLPEEKLNWEIEDKTKFHKIFYDKLNNNWKEFIDIYENFIKVEITKLIDEPFAYQYLPTYRVQLPNEKAIHEWHFDSDDNNKHPNGEINFCIAISKMKNSTAIWSESLPGKKDFSPMEIDYGEFYNFNGNKCTHGNKINISDNVRISLDFRIMPKSKYSPKKIKTSTTSKKKFIIGEYYKASDDF